MNNIRICGESGPRKLLTGFFLKQSKRIFNLAKVMTKVTYTPEQIEFLITEWDNSVNHFIKHPDVSISAVLAACETRDTIRECVETNTTFPKHIIAELESIQRLLGAHISRNHVMATVTGHNTDKIYLEARGANLKTFKLIATILNKCYAAKIGESVCQN